MYIRFPRLLMLATLAGAALVSGTAFAGTCPADKMRPDGSGAPASQAAAKDVTDTILATIDVSKEPAGIHDRLFRLRRLEVKPGGVVPWHSHGNRPAIIYIVQGEITEHASTCAVPIRHRAGETASETHATSHWWKNESKGTVVLLSADLFPTSDDDHHMM